MRKLIFTVFVISLLGGATAQAQRADSLRVRQMSDSLSRLYERYFKLEEQAAQVERRVNTSLTGVEGKVKAIENLSQGNAEELRKISDKDLRTQKTIYEKNRLSVIASANLMDEINNALNDLEASISSLDYSSAVADLNNPTNRDLGFSLDKAIIKIMDEKIIQGKFGRRIGDRLRNIVSGIINNPIVNPIINNPLTKALVATVPAVNSLTSVFNVVNTLAVNEGEVGIAALQGFNKEMQRYVAHYEALAKATRDLDFNLANMKLKIESVEKLATNFVRQAVEQLYTRNAVPNLSAMDLNTLVKRHYNYAASSELIKQLERDNGNNYQELLKRVAFSQTDRSKAAFMTEEVEKLFNEYLTMLQSYHNNIIVVLNNATQLSEDPNLIKTKIYDLDSRYKKLIENCEKQVDLPNIKALEAVIPKF